MNTFLFEIKLRLGSFIIWTLCICAVLFIFMFGIFPIYMENAKDMLSLIESYPKELLLAFGFEIETMFSFGGFYSFSFTYTGLIGSIMAASLGISIFSAEKRNKCMDFILTKPVSRENLFLSKLSAAIAYLVVVNAIFIASAVMIYNSNDVGTITFEEFIIASFSLFLTQLVFLAIGIFFAVCSKKIRSVSSTATTLGFAFFGISALYNVLKEEFLRFISPLKYFDPLQIFVNGSFEAKYVLSAIVVVAICVILSFVKFCKSDVNAV